MWLLPGLGIAGKPTLTTSRRPQPGTPIARSLDMARRLAASACFAWLAWGAVATGAAEAITMTIAPSVCYSPGLVYVPMTIEPHPANRAVEIIADSPDFCRSSLIQLEGERAPRTISLRFRDLPPGEYAFVADLTDAAGRKRAGFWTASC
jgi:hypothetical protein